MMNGVPPEEGAAGGASGGSLFVAYLTTGCYNYLSFWQALVRLHVGDLLDLPKGSDPLQSSQRRVKQLACASHCWPLALQWLG